MATLRAALKAVLEADSTLTTLLTGGVWDSDELPRSGIPAAATFETANGVRLKPCAVIQWSTSAATQLSHTPASERRFVHIYFYADKGQATIDQARNRVKSLLHRKQLGVTDDAYGMCFVNWVDDMGEFTAESMHGAAASRTRFAVDFTRR